eukprot:TRINITY_DN8340_c0_g1_i2.p1 TRINITY_DN8340_c0_g1~~TRINITY_DN8340_c0_g1_i2.p1  ORF type:complete len:128 (+),score=8.94 TRINITY_DN8340_c0_g1_i2:35-385(+)
MLAADKIQVSQVRKVCLNDRLTRLKALWHSTLIDVQQIMYKAEPHAHNQKCIQATNCCTVVRIISPLQRSYERWRQVRMEHQIQALTTSQQFRNMLVSLFCARNTMLCEMFRLIAV